MIPNILLVSHFWQTSRIIAKIACWSKELMGLDDLRFYMDWLKNQLRLPVSKLIEYWSYNLYLFFLYIILGW